MANKQVNYEYVLPVGTVLISKGGSDGKERRYKIERVVNGRPLPKGEKTKSSDIVAPVLGQGGFGITYLASRKIKDGNIDLGTVYYAIKEFFIKGSCYREDGDTQMRYSPASEKDVKESMKDFKDEANRLKEICKGNPNIVNVNEVFEANGTAYYVMEFLEGESLRNLVRRTGPLSEGVALSFIRPIAEAVMYIHTQHRLLHLDIKPDNIMLRKSADGQQADPVLIDFGVSVHFNKKGDLTTTHTSVGTSEGYSPQEQYGGVEKIIADRKRAHNEGFTNVPLIPCEVDVYALGATLYYTLVGANPYNAFSMTTDIVKAKLPQSVSEKTRQVVVDAMQPMYSNRTKTAADFLKGFEDRYTLPKGFVLNSPNAHYLITDVQKESEYYIQYGASIYVGANEPQSKNITKTQRYIVFEQFNRRMYKRLEDESVIKTELYKSSPDWKENEKTAFFTTCKKRLGLTEINDSEMDGTTVIKEMFKTNGTVYAVVNQGWKPVPSYVHIIQNISKVLKVNRKTIGVVAAVVLSLVIAGYGIYKGMASYSQRKAQIQQERLRQSVLLSSAINKKDSAQLVLFAGMDSVRSYLPLANICLQAVDTANARKFAGLALVNGNEQEASIIIQVIDSIKNSVAPTDSVQRSTMDIRQEIEKPTKEKKDNIEKKPGKQNDADVITPVNNVKAKQAEAAKKALQYINGERTYENHQKAYKWALQADPDTKAKVLQRLKDMDFPMP